MTSEELNETLNQKFPKIYWLVKESDWDMDGTPIEYLVKGMAIINDTEYRVHQYVHPPYLNKPDYVSYIANIVTNKIAKELLN